MMSTDDRHRNLDKLFINKISLRHNSTDWLRPSIILHIQSDSERQSFIETIKPKSQIRKWGQIKTDQKNALQACATEVNNFNANTFKPHKSIDRTAYNIIGDFAQLTRVFLLVKHNTCFFFRRMQRCDHKIRRSCQYSISCICENQTWAAPNRFC